MESTGRGLAPMVRTGACAGETGAGAGLVLLYGGITFTLGGAP